MANDDTNTINPIAITERIVTAYLGQNQVALSDISNVFTSVWNSVQALTAGGNGSGTTTSIASSATTQQTQTPAVNPDDSVKPDYIICLEDGKQMTMLKRHLATAYNLTPEQYRAKWGLPSTYPMTAPNYALRRSELAKQIGLGRPKASTPAPAPTRGSQASSAGAKGSSYRPPASRSKKADTTTTTRRSGRNSSAAPVH